jgi:hypothetical protein
MLDMLDTTLEFLSRFRWLRMTHVAVCSEACKILLSVSARSGSAEARMLLRLAFYSSYVSKS